MIYSACEIKKTLKLININTGVIMPTVPGRYDLASLYQRPRDDSPNILDYFVLASNQDIGAIRRYWEDKELEGSVSLIREVTDLTIDGVKLPITSSNQLTEDQKKLPCGYIIKGLFHCTKCAEGKVTKYPNSIEVFSANIIPYSQDCHICGNQIFDIWKSNSGGPLNLFRKPGGS